MSRKNCTFVAVFALLAVMTGWSETPDLSAFAEAALENDPERLIAIEQLRVAESDADATKIKRLIDGSASAQITRTDPGDSSVTGKSTSLSGDLSASSSLPFGSTLSYGGSYGYSTNKLTDSDSATIKAGLRTPILVNGKFVDPRIGDAARASAIELPVEAAREASETRARATVDAVFRLALDAASASRSVSIAESRLEIADRDLVIAEVKRDQGIISYSDLAEKQRTSDEARLSALETRLARDSKIRALCAATGIDFASLDPVALTVLSAPDSARANGLLSEAVTSAEMKKATRDRKTAESNRILSGVEVSPSFSLSSSVTLPGPVTRADDANADTSWSASASVSVPLPTGYVGNRRSSADARLEAARIAESATALDAADRMTSLRDTWTACDAKVTLRAQLLEQAASRLALVRSSFAANTAMELDVDRAVLAEVESRAAYEDSRSALFKASLDIATFCGIDPRTLLKEETK